MNLDGNKMAIDVYMLWSFIASWIASKLNGEFDVTKYHGLVADPWS